MRRDHDIIKILRYITVILQFPILKENGLQIFCKVLGEIECSSEVEIGKAHAGFDRATFVSNLKVHDGHDIAVLVSKFIFY